LKETKQEEMEVREDCESVDSNLEATVEEMESTKGTSEDLEQKLAEKTAQYEDIFSQFQRLQADFTNYKKRVEKEKGDIYLYANEKIALDLLNIIDNFERAIQSTEKTEENDSLLQGISLVYKQLLDTLTKHGVEEIEAMEKPFDMNLHYAVMQEESEGASNYVIDVLQKGYKIKDRILRPAMVKVSK